MTPRKAAWLASLGGSLEYYDFAIYGLMMPYLSSLFFSSGSMWKTLGVFAVGYLARPLGGLVFGLIGDTKGRKTAFLSVLLLMATATAAIGLLPISATSIAAFWLVLLRVLQGLSFGAELPGAITVVTECAPSKSHGLYSSWIVSSASLGSIFAALILALTTSVLSKEQILLFGWRLPFLFGGLLGGVAYWMRRRLQETPVFSKPPAASSLKEPLLHLARHHPISIASGFCLVVLPASLVIFCLYLPSYASTYFGYDPSSVYFAMTWAMLWSAISLPIFGRLADLFGKQTLFISGCLAWIALAWPLFLLLASRSTHALILFLLIYQTVISALMPSCLALLSSYFAAKSRYTGTALCYNLGYAATSFIPAAILYTIEQTSSPFAAVWCLVACAAISLGSFLVQRIR